MGNIYDKTFGLYDHDPNDTDAEKGEPVHGQVPLDSLQSNTYSKQFYEDDTDTNSFGNSLESHHQDGDDDDVQEKDFLITEVENAIEDKDLNYIKNLVTPVNLAKETDSLNIVERSFQISYMLKNVHGPRSKEFQEIGDEVEDFARYLLSYSNDFSGIVSRRKFIKCIKRLTDKAIEYNAKKFLAAKNAQDFLSWIWTGDYCKTTNTNVTWLLLNIWAPFETVLFPLVFAILYIYQKIHKNSRHDQDWSNEPIQKLPKKLLDKSLKQLENAHKKTFHINEMTIEELTEKCLNLKNISCLRKITQCFPYFKNPIGKLPPKTREQLVKEIEKNSTLKTFVENLLKTVCRNRPRIKIMLDDLTIEELEIEMLNRDYLDGIRLISSSILPELRKSVRELPRGARDQIRKEISNDKGRIKRKMIENIVTIERLEGNLVKLGYVDVLREINQQITGINQSVKMKDYPSSSRKNSKGKELTTITELKEEFWKKKDYLGLRELNKSIAHDVQQPIKLLSPTTMGKVMKLCETNEILNLENLITVHLLKDYCWKTKNFCPYQEITSFTECLFDRYKRHFQIPYFIFVRDFVSYLALLVIHFVLCVQPVTLKINVLEWIIMTIFLGRIFIEVDQFICISHHSISRYIRDFWNQMDLLTITIYIAMLVCRSLAEQSNSTLLTVASYLYSVNVIILSLRVFGQIMEITQSTGTKQIAFMKIVRAVGVIFIQMLGAVLAFSFALVNIYMIEVSKLDKTNTTLSNTTEHGVCGHSLGITCWWHFIELLGWSIVGEPQQSSLNLENATSNYISKVLYLLFLVVVAVIIMNMLIALLSNKYQEVEDNAFFEWAFKKSCLIKTYSTHHPITIPLCIISLPIKMVFICLKKWKVTAANEATDNKKEKEKEKSNEIEGILKKFCKKMEREYFAEYGNSFPKDNVAKIDRNIRQNRYFMGRIAKEVFKENETVTDSRDWTCKEGIKVAGRQLFHVKCRSCRGQMKYPKCVHGARYNKPLSEEYPGFEVLIQQSGKKRFFGIGVVSHDYELFHFPGRKKNSVGYHIDTGRTFEEEKAIESYDAVMSYVGDIIRCMVLFDERDGQYFPVQFYHNGTVIGKAKLSVQIFHNGGIYPLISMASPDFHVMFRRVASENISTNK